MAKGDDLEEQLAAVQQRLERVQREIVKYRILSTLPNTKSGWWSQAVDTVFTGKNRLGRLTERAGIPDISVLFKLLARAHRYDAVLLTGGERVDILYLAVAALLPWMRTPHLIVDAHWQKSEGLAYFLQKALLRLGRRLTAQVQPHSTEEIGLYHEIFDIPLPLLHAVPWSTTLTGHDVSPARPEERGDFVLSGGVSFRDYPTLFEAVRGLDLEVQIGLPKHPLSQAIIERGRDCPNIRFHTDWSNAQFIRKMAGCKVFALPIEPGLTRSTADQTILNAMYFGKVVVATNSIGSRIYLRNGENGFLVPERDPAAWRATLERVQRMSDDEYARIGARAAYDAKVHFSEPLRMVRTLEAALDVLSQRRG